MNDWDSSLFSWNYPNIMNRLNPNAKYTGKEMKGPKASLLEDKLGFPPTSCHLSMKTRTLSLCFALLWLFNLMLFACWVRLFRTGPCLQPYHPEHAPSRLISEATQGRAWLVPGWENQLSLPVCLCDVTSRGFPIRILTGPLCWIQHRGLLVQWKCTTLASAEEAILSHSITPVKISILFFIKSQ